MTHIKKWASMVLVFIGFFYQGVGYANESTDQIPLEVFGKLPNITSPVLSPDGKYIAALMAIDGVYHVAVADFDKRQLQLVLKFNKEDRKHLNWINWANNNRLIVSYTWLTASSDVGTRTGNDVNYTRLLALDRDGKNIKYLEYDIFKAMKGSKVGRKSRELNSVNQDHIIDFLPKDKDHILVQLDGSVDWGVQYVYKLNVYTAEYTQVQKNFQNIYDWITDWDGQLKLGVARDENSPFLKEYHYRESAASSDWEKIIEYTLFKDAITWFLSFDSTGEKLYLASHQNSDRASLHLFDPKTKKMSEPIFNHPKVDIEGVFYDFAKKRVTGVKYTDDLPSIHYFNEEDAQFQRAIDKFLPDLSNRIISQSLDGNRKIIASVSDRQPLKYYLHDQAKNSLRSWYFAYPEIKPRQMAERRAITFKARDGMELYGYLTIPEATKEKLPPLVVFPHGGPQARDTAAFDPFAQALASRGYAVLQVNFRGSTGYGTRYEVAGYREWGWKMQDDLTDGLRWVAEKKLADSTRACIMGMSYGGYAALMGVIKDPDQYQCAISFAGVTDLPRIVTQWRFQGSSIEETIGKSNSDRIHEASPYHLVEKIKVPLLLIHGERDGVVNSEDLEAMVKKLKKLGKQYKLVLFEDGDHHLSIEEDRIRFINEVDAFLQTYLPVNSLVDMETK